MIEYSTITSYPHSKEGYVDALILDEYSNIGLKTLEILLVNIGSEGSDDWHYVLIAPPDDLRYIFLNLDNQYRDTDNSLSGSDDSPIATAFRGGLNLFEKTYYQSFNTPIIKTFDEVFYRSSGLYYILGSFSFKKAFQDLSQ